MAGRAARESTPGRTVWVQRVLFLQRAGVPGRLTGKHCLRVLLRPAMLFVSSGCLAPSNPPTPPYPPHWPAAPLGFMAFSLATCLFMTSQAGITEPSTQVGRVCNQLLGTNA